MRTRHLSRRDGMRLVGGGIAGAALLGTVRQARADDLAEVKQRGVLTCATEMQFAPFDFLVNGEYQGMCKDLMTEVTATFGVKPRFLDLPWPSILPGLEAGKYDVCTAPVTITKERMKRYAFTVPFAEATVGLMKRAGDASIAKPADIAGKAVGVQKGTAQMAQLKEYGATLGQAPTIKEYIDNNVAYADLVAGRIVAVASSFPNIAYAALKRQDTFALVMPPFGQKSYFAWALRAGPDSMPLVQAINDAIVTMNKNGKLADLQKKWLGVAVDLPTSIPTPAV